MTTTIITGFERPDDEEPDDLDLALKDWLEWQRDLEAALRIVAVARGWVCPDRL